MNDHRNVSAPKNGQSAPSQLQESFRLGLGPTSLPGFTPTSHLAPRISWVPQSPVGQDYRALGRQDRMGTSLCYDSNSSRLRSEVSAKHIKYVLPFLFVMDHMDAKPLMCTLLLPALRTQWFTMLPYMHAPEVLGVHGGGFGKDQESFQDQETHKWLHIH